MARRRCQFASLSAAVGSPLVTIVKRCKLHQVWKRTTEQYLVISSLRYAIISSRKNFGRLDVTAAQIGCGGGASRDPASQRSSGIDTSSVAMHQDQGHHIQRRRSERQQGVRG